MQTSLTLKRTDAAAGSTAHEHGASAAGRILMRVFETLDRAGVRYCVLHGYEDFPREVRSDVDCIVDRRVTGARLHSLLQETPILSEPGWCAGAAAISSWPAVIGTVRMLF
jgi:hypothetical protein